MLFELEGYEDDLDYRSIPLSAKTPCTEAVELIVKKFQLPGKANEYYLVEVSEECEGKAFCLSISMKNFIPRGTSFLFERHNQTPYYQIQQKYVATFCNSSIYWCHFVQMIERR